MVSMDQKKKLSTLSVAIMAAGKGTRMKSDLPKVLHVVMGRPMLFHVLQAAEAAGAGSLILISGHGHEQVDARVREQFPDVRFVLQAEQLGTGHAVRTAMPQVPDDCEEVMILSGDTPLLTAEMLSALLERHRGEDAVATVVSMIPPDPGGYGRILRTADGEQLDRIVEHKDATEEERQTREVNAGIYLFRKADLEYSLGQLKNENAQGEFYLTDTLAIIRGYGGKVVVYQALDADDCRGVNSRLDLLECQEIMKERINRQLMADGVSIYSMDDVYVEAGCQIGPDTILYPGTIIRGQSVVGRDCRIGPQTLISDSSVGDGSALHYVVVENAEIPAGSSAGPWQHLKGGRV